MSLYPNIQDNSSETVDEGFLETVSNKIDPTNLDLLKTFMKLQNDPKSPEILQEFIIKLLPGRKESPITHRLAAYLKSHVELLEAITHNVDLASLFLVGENGKQSFKSIHKSILSEQAARTRKFLASNDFDDSDVDTNLADYNLFISNVCTIGTKLEALEDIAEQAAHCNNVDDLRNAYDELSSLFTGCLIFNDVLIQNAAKNRNANEIKKAFPGAPEDANEFKDWVNDKIKSKDCASQTIQTLQNEQKRLLSKLKETETELDIKKREVKSLKKQIRENISLIKDQKNDLTQKISLLQEKIQDINNTSNSNDSMRAELQRLQNRMQEKNDQAEMDMNCLRNENNSLKEKVSQLQSDLMKKDAKIANLQGKVASLKEGKDEFANMNKQHYNEVAELQKLYQNSSDSLYQAKEKIQELKREKQNLQDQVKNQKRDSKELRDLLERTKARVKEQMNENDILLKQLQKGSNSDNEIDALKNEISDLKKKLNDANKFIAKLQKEIEDFRRNQKENYSRNKSNHKHMKSSKHHGKDYSSSVNSSNNEYTDSTLTASSESVLSPTLKGLDKEIRKLEKNVTISRKVLEENSFGRN